jgi:hypothetical protein
MALGRRAIEIVIDVIGEILAFFTVILILLMCINGAFNNFMGVKATKALTYVREIAIVVVIGLKGLEFALKRSWILTGIFIVLLAAIAVFMFFPSSLPSWLGGTANGGTTPSPAPPADGGNAEKLLGLIS